jgi:hypothetical protein
MTAAVELGDGDALGCEGVSHVAIEPTVCGIAVDHDQGQSCLALRTIVLDVDLAPGTLQGSFEVWGRSGLHHAGIAWTLPRWRIIVPGRKQCGFRRSTPASTVNRSTRGCLAPWFAPRDAIFAASTATPPTPLSADATCPWMRSWREVKRLALPFVLLTGGEPMLQVEIAALAERLVVRMDTRWPSRPRGPICSIACPPAVFRIVDVKTPSSGESQRMQWQVLEGLRPCDAVKFVLSDESDYRWSADHVIGWDSRRGPRCSFRPCTASSTPRIWSRGSFATGSRFGSISSCTNMFGERTQGGCNPAHRGARVGTLPLASTFNPPSRFCTPPAGRAFRASAAGLLSG